MISLIYKKFKPASKTLDLGCGQGKDFLFLAQNGFIVHGVDKSSEAVQSVNHKIQEFSLDKASVELGDIRNYEIKKDYFDVIICHNVLNFVTKEEALKIINNIKEAIKPTGYVLMQVFTVDDPSFRKEKQLACYFEPQELGNIFSDFEIEEHFAGIIHDEAHQGFEAPHQHGIAKIVAKKII